MKKLFVIGDSISMHYGPFLKKYLAGKMAYGRKGEFVEAGDLNRESKVNGGDSSHVLQYLQESPELEYDVLLLNCGLHDIKTTDKRQIEPEAYEKNLRAILEFVEKPVIWVRTTPVEDARHQRYSPHFSRYDRDVVLYNEIADKVMAEFGVPVIDLYHFTKALMQDGEVYGEHDHVHFCDEVRKLQAAYIAGAVLRIVE